MDIKDFNEALYASSDGVIVERRKSFVMPLIVLLAGIGLLVANYFIENGNDANNLKSALILVGGVVSVAGIALCGVRIFGGGVPYHKEDKCYLIRKQYSFVRAQQSAVVKAVEKCDKLALDGMNESEIAAISVICYYSPRSRYCIMQAFAYEELLYKEITPIHHN